MRLQVPSELFSTAVTQAELLYGVALLPRGKRRADFQAAVTNILVKVLADRILPFDSEAAKAYAQIASTRRAMGRPISDANAQIAAIAQSRGASLATRDSRDFEHCGIKVFNPWNG